MLNDKSCSNKYAGDSIRLRIHPVDTRIAPCVGEREFDPPCQQLICWCSPIGIETADLKSVQCGFESHHQYHCIIYQRS